MQRNQRTDEKFGSDHLSSVAFLNGGFVCARVELGRVSSVGGLGVLVVIVDGGASEPDGCGGETDADKMPRGCVGGVTFAGGTNVGGAPGGRNGGGNGGRPPGGKGGIPGGSMPGRPGNGGSGYPGGGLL